MCERESEIGKDNIDISGCSKSDVASFGEGKKNSLSSSF